MSSAATTTTETRTNNTRGRGRGGQRGRRGRGGQKNGAPRDPAPISKPDSLPAVKSEAQLSPTASPGQVKNGTDADAESADDGVVCWICAEPVKYWSVSQCNHRTCHVCALRLRALYKKLECTFCKVCTAILVALVDCMASLTYRAQTRNLNRLSSSRRLRMPHGRLTPQMISRLRMRSFPSRSRPRR